VKYKSDQYNKDDDDSHKKKKNTESRYYIAKRYDHRHKKKNEVNIIEIHNGGVGTTQKERKRWCVCVSEEKRRC